MIDPNHPLQPRSSLSSQEHALASQHLLAILEHLAPLFDLLKRPSPLLASYVLEQGEWAKLLQQQLADDLGISEGDERAFALYYPAGQESAHIGYRAGRARR